MAQRGRKAAVSAETILSTILDNSFLILDDNNQLKLKGNVVWTEISEALENRIKPETVYLYFFTNHNDLYSNVCKHLGLEINATKKRKLASFSDSEAESVISDEPPKKKKGGNKILKFNLTLEGEVWDSMKPIQRGRKLIFKDDWTYTMFIEVYKAGKLPCAFNFSEHVIHKQTLPIIVIKAYCKDCKATLVAESNDCPTGSKVTLQITTKNSRLIPHPDARRRLAGTELEKKMILVEFRNPKQVRRELISEEMSVGDSLPPVIPTESALCRAKQKQTNRKLGITPGISLWDSLVAMKDNIEFNDYIKDIGFDKFHLTYFSRDQITLYNNIQKYSRTPVAIDATGSLITSIIRPNGESREIFMHALVTHIDNKIIPVAQVLTEKNDSNFLTWWLNEWRKSGAITPKEAVTDLCKAIQNAACLSFNLSTYKDYIDNCFSILIGQVKIVKNLECWLRVDIAHLTNAVRKWACFDKSDSRVKLFFRRCIGLLSNIKTFEMFKETLKEVLMVAGNAIETPETETARRNLISKIKSYNFDINDKHDDNNKDEPLMTSQIIDCTEDSDKDDSIRPIFSYVNNLKKVIRSEAVSNQLNASNFDAKKNDFYLPDFLEPFCHLIMEFPAWTCVMQDYFQSPFDYATSARVESYFSDVKINLMDNRRRGRVDKYLIKHIRSIDSDIKEGTSIFDRHKDSGEYVLQKQVAKNNNIEHIIATENWRGKGDKMEEYLVESCTDTAINLTGENTINCIPQISAAELDIKCLDSDGFTSVALDHSYHMKQLDYDSFNDQVDLESTKIEIVEIKVESNHQIKPEKNVKKRGKFVAKDPDIDVHLQKPKNVKDHNIMRNGSCLAERTIFHRKHKVINTCPFDSCTELLKRASMSSELFQTFLNDSSLVKVGNYVNDFKKQDLNYARTVLDYIADGPKDILYKKRAYILHSQFDHNEKIIDCRFNIHKFFEILMNNYSSPLEQVTCKQCGDNNTKNKIIMPIPNINEILKNGYANIQNNLLSYISDQIVYCHVCHKDTAIKKYIKGNYIMIDTDDVYNGSSNTAFTTNIIEIPTTIIIEEDQFMLCGVVEFVPPIDVNGIGHYVPYLRNTNNEWEKRNNLQKKAIKVRKQDSNIRISAILYVKY